MASNSGITVVVAIGLLALAAWQETACEPPPDQAGDRFVRGPRSRACAGGGVGVGWRPVG